MREKIKKVLLMHLTKKGYGIEKATNDIINIIYGINIIYRDKKRKSDSDKVETCDKCGKKVKVVFTELGLLGSFCYPCYHILTRK